MGKYKTQEVVLTKTHQELFWVVTLTIIDNHNWIAGLNVLVKEKMCHNEKLMKRCREMMQLEYSFILEWTLGNVRYRSP